MPLPASPLALTGFLPAWDLARRRVDLASLTRWLLQRLAQLGVATDDLASLHLHLDGAQALAASRALTAATSEDTPRRLIERAVREALVGITPERIWLQTHAHVRILVPHDDRATFPPHSDFGFGHSLDERNLWLALTDAEGDEALHVLPLGASLAWMSQTGRVHGVLDPAPDIPPVRVQAGEVLLFTPLHLHRARPPSGARSRVSVDVRIIPRPATPGDLTFSPLRATP